MLLLDLFHIFVIIYRCCEALVLGWKNKPLSEQTEDLECLCHLMRTCGRILDSSNGKFRMDQYFERMDQVGGKKLHAKFCP